MIANLNLAQSVVKAYKVQSKGKPSNTNERRARRTVAHKDVVTISKKGRTLVMKELSTSVKRLSGALSAIGEEKRNPTIF